MTELIKKALSTKRLIAATAVIILMFALLIVILVLTWRPTMIEKTTFSDADIAVITDELGIPDGSFSVEEMKFSHAKESYFCISGKAYSLDAISSYESSGEGSYILKDAEDPHGDIRCTVSMGQPYELVFELNDWNEELYGIIR